MSPEEREQRLAKL